MVDPISLSAIALTIFGPALSAIAKGITQRRRKQQSAPPIDVSPWTANARNIPAEQLERLERDKVTLERDKLTLEVQSVRVPAGIIVLVAFAFLLIVFGAYSLYHYWALISKNSETLMFAIWLFLAMVGGMFVQVLAANRRAERPLFDVSVSQLVFPLLFALIVFYPIWALAASSPRNLFPFYAAFLNGYFWESVVSAAKAPAADVPKAP